MTSCCGCRRGDGEPRGGVGRRDFLASLPACAAGVPLALAALDRAIAAAGDETAPRPAKKPAVVKVGYLRPRGARAGGWPGHGYDVNANCREYSAGLEKLGKELGMRIEAGPAAALYGQAEIAKFVASVKAEKPDAILLVPIGLGRWGQAQRILGEARGIPALIFSHIGASFTMHTTPLATRPGVHLEASCDIRDMRRGLELVKTASALRQSTVLVFHRRPRKGLPYGAVGTRLRFVPSGDYIAAYRKQKVTDEMRRVAEDCAKRAKAVRGIDAQRILDAAKHYFTCKQFLAQHGGDGLTSDCLPYVGTVGTPCLAFSKLMDEGIPAGCEADVGSAMTMMLIHSLLGRPGFMADPLVDTARNLWANAHCTCPTRLSGFGGPSEPFVLRPHHSGAGVAVQVFWRIGQVITLARFQKPEMLLVDRATVKHNYESPPSAACITNVGAVVDGAEDNPHKVAGFHVVQFYGDHVKTLRAYAHLHGIEAVQSWDPRVSFNFSPNYP